MFKVLKITSLYYLWNILKKKWEMKLFFNMKINIKVVYKLIPKVIFGGCGHVYSNCPKSQICIWNIPRKKSEVKLIVWIQINAKVFTSRFLLGVVCWEDRRGSGNNVSCFFLSFCFDYFSFLWYGESSAFYIVLNVILVEERFVNEF